MKILQKILILLLTICLCACSSESTTTIKEEITKDGSYYLNELISYSPREKNKENTIDNASFDEFLDQCFKEYLESDYIEMRAYVLDYENYDVDKPTVKWQDFNYKDTSATSLYEDQLNGLSNFDFSSLSYTQQFEYEKHEYYLLEKICNIYYSQYDRLFSRSYDLLYFVFLNLDEYRFDTKEYLDDYFLLVADSYRLIEDALTYTSKQAEDGIYLDNGSIDYTFEYAVQLMGNSESDNPLVNSFNKRVEQLDFLSEEEKESYKQKNQEYVQTYFIPALEKLNQEIVNYYDLADPSQELLCNINKDYARFKLLLNTSSTFDPQTLLDNCLNVFNTLADSYKEAKQDESVLQEYNLLYSENTYESFQYNDEEELKYLENNISVIVPTINNLSYVISRLDNAGDDSSIIAYFLQPTIDNLDSSTMRTNPNMMGQDPITDYVVVAHEGLPGHMYQFLYYMNTNPSDITSIHSYIGYKEGWATYSMLEALNCSGIQLEGTKNIIEFSFLSSYYLYSMGDICFNYFGYSLEEFEAFLEDNGLNSNYASAIYETVTQSSGTYEQYGIGCCEMLRLKQKVKDALGDDFDEVDFNCEILVHGPLPMVVLEKAIDDYILEKQN